MTTTRRTPPKVPRPAPAPVAASPLVADLTARVRAARPTEVAAVVEDFWAGAVTPVIDSDDVVTFLWRDAHAEQVLLFVNRLTDERDLTASLLRRVEGTDVWHLSYRMDRDWRASYSFLPHAGAGRPPWVGADDQVAIRVALDHGMPDPRNTVTSRNRAGVVQSVVELAAAPPQPWLAARPGVPRGTVTRATEPGGRTVWLYEPPGATTDLSVLVALDGEVWTGPQDLPTTLDNLIHEDAIRPTCAVLVDSGGRDRRWGELDETGDLRDHLALGLLDWVRDVLPVGAGRERVTVAGQSLGALTALWSLVRHPDRVGAAISQSASLWQDAILDAVPTADLRGTRAWVEVGRQEWVLRPRHPEAVDLLRAAGCDVRYDEFNGGHDYACWRGGIADGLRDLHGVDLPGRPSGATIA